MSFPCGGGRNQRQPYPAMLGMLRAVFCWQWCASSMQHEVPFLNLLVQARLQLDRHDSLRLQGNVSGMCPPAATRTVRPSSPLLHATLHASHSTTGLPCHAVTGWPSACTLPRCTGSAACCKLSRSATTCQSCRGGPATHQPACAAAQRGGGGGAGADAPPLL